jgi:drug/metabolite transporter (DMT)-like permease
MFLNHLDKEVLFGSFPFTLPIFGFQHFDLNLGAIVLSSELFFTILFGLFIFGEVSATSEVIGGICIVLAITLLNAHYWNRGCGRK